MNIYDVWDKDPKDENRSWLRETQISIVRYYPEGKDYPMFMVKFGEMELRSYVEIGVAKANALRQATQYYDSIFD